MADDDVPKEPGTEVSFPLPATRPVNLRPQKFLENVDTVLSKLWPDEDFRKYLDKLTNKSAIEGKFEADRTMAAYRIRNEAGKVDLVDVATAKLNRIMRAIETLLRRDGYGRKQRLALLAAPVEADLSATPAE
jgi:hypothetical protein